MDFIDIMEEISARRVVKTETGDNRIFGVVVGIVDKNYDVNQPGKVCVRIPNRDTNSNVLKWAKVVAMYMGKNWGSYVIPEVGDEVLVTFEEGNIDKPYVVGCIPKSDAKLVGKSSDRNNSIKQVKARNGKSFVKYEDDGQTENQEDNLRIELFDGKLFMDMDSRTETVIIADKNKENMLMIDGQDNSGLLRIKTKNKLEINVSDSISVKMDGQTGKLSLKCDTLDIVTNKKTNVKASGGIKLDTDGEFGISSNKTIIKSGGSINLEASGTVGVNGNAIKLG